MTDDDLPRAMLERRLAERLGKLYEPLHKPTRWQRLVKRIAKVLNIHLGDYRIRPTIKRLDPRDDPHYLHRRKE